MPGATSSFHTTVPGSLTSSEPVWVACCQAPKKAPAGSVTSAIRPWSAMSIGGPITVPPAPGTAAANASASSTAR